LLDNGNDSTFAYYIIADRIRRFRWKSTID
jgi:hypothetical protein